MVEVTVSVRETDHPDVLSFTCQQSAAEWSAYGEAMRTARGFVITQLDVRAGTDHTGGVTGGLLRQVPTGEILKWVHVAAAQMPPTPQESKPTHEPARPGRAPLSDELLRSVAEAYLRETAPGQERGALRRMAQEFGKPENTVNGWIKKARERGWLGPSTAGRAGAEPGPRLTRA